MNHKRHIGIYDASRWDVTLIGCGGIGSMTALVLAKMGVLELALVDFDKVAEENISTQLYKMRDEKAHKVYALGDILSEFSDVPIYCYASEASRVLTAGLSSRIIISAVDSIQARKDIWRTMGVIPWQWYIDARMGAEYFMCYTVNTNDADEYSWWLAAQRDEDIPDDPCTSKATFYTAAIAAGHIGSIVRDISKGIVPPTVIAHDVPHHGLVVVPHA